MNQYLTAYRFVRLTDLPKIRQLVLDFCRQNELMGTILIAEEGINIGLTGSSSSMNLFLELAKNRFQMVDSDFKISETDQIVFHRLLVKIKKEIISLGIPDIRPDEFTGPRLDAKTLKAWLDESKDIVLLDTRNDYEVKVGTFKGAHHLSLETFRQFGNSVQTLQENLKDKTVVSFCTGGIRCEKASALLLKLGLKNVYQLDGGIIRYFEQNGSAHFEGNCFVFDWRLAVDGHLNPVPRSADPNETFGRHRS